MEGFCPLASGSKGNCTYFGTKEVRFLIDAGISFKLLEERLEQIEVAPDTIDAILITHEHSDHIKGLKTWVHALSLPVFCNSDTAKAICEAFQEVFKFRIFSSGETFSFGDVDIFPFTVQHDAVDPVAFTCTWQDQKVGICTDLGLATSWVHKCLERCDYLILEANHEPSMVHASSRPLIYKQRVLSRQGHLSNQECGALLKSILHPGLKHVHLAHLSSECNAKERALETVYAELNKQPYPPSMPLPEISIAHQEELSRPIFFSKTHTTLKRDG